MAYIFRQDDLPRMLSVVPGRERVFFASKELTDMDDMLAGVMYYDEARPLRITCTRTASASISFSKAPATFETEDGVQDLEPGDLVFIPAEEKHRLRSKTPLFISSSRHPTGSRPRFSTVRKRISCGNVETARFGYKASAMPR